MKKIIILPILLLSIVTLGGCSNQQINQTEKGPKSNVVTSQTKNSKITQVKLVKKIEAANLGYSFTKGMSQDGNVGVFATNEKFLGISLKLGVEQKYTESMSIDAMFFPGADQGMVQQIDDYTNIMASTIGVVTQNGAEWVGQEFQAIKSNPSKDRETSNDFDDVTVRFDYTITQLFIIVIFK